MPKRKHTGQRTVKATGGEEPARPGSDLSLMGYFLHMADTALLPGIRRVYELFAAGERHRLGQRGRSWRDRGQGVSGGEAADPGSE